MLILEICVLNPKGPCPFRKTVSYAKELTPDLGIVFCDTVLETVEDADAVVLVTEWPAYRDLPWDDICKLMRTPTALVLDGRNYLNRVKLEALGFRYIGVGK